MDMTIRRGKISDLEKLMKFLNSAPELQTGAEGQAYSKSFVRACLTDRKMSLVLVAEDKREIIGFLIAELWKRKKISFLVDLFVESQYRKQGIATKLREEHEKICKKLGIKTINVLVLLNNKKMQGYMEKRGYKRGHSFYFYEKEIK